MAYSTINDPSAYFQTKTYTGTGSSNAITNDGNSDLQPDWIWGKATTQTYNHNVFDTSRGLTKRLTIDQSDAENTDSTTITAVGSDGFTLGTSANLNGSSVNYVAWQWKANGGTTSSNTDGTITSTVQANTTAGFSIITYSGNGSNNATVGHGLGATPKMIITKNRSAAYNWIVYHPTLAATKILVLDMDLAEFTPSGGYYSNVGSSTYQLVQGSSNLTNVNANGNDYVAYCFAEKQGYSKFGNYTGNGSSDGPFVYTGFKTAFVMVKNISSAAPWRIYSQEISNHATPFNDLDETIFPDTNAAATDTSHPFDFTSNGFKVRGSNVDVNTDGDQYIYMAFAAQSLVGTNNVIALAR